MKTVVVTSAVSMMAPAAILIAMAHESRNKGDSYDPDTVTKTLSINKEGYLVGPNGMTMGGQLMFLSFLVYEMCIGVFWPGMMSMRSRYVPEELRSTIINLFRIPLNLFVCIVLYNVDKVPQFAMFALCSCFMLICWYCQSSLEIEIKAKARC